MSNGIEVDEVADMVVGMVADMVVGMVADMVVKIVGGMVAGLEVDKYCIMDT